MQERGSITVHTENIFPIIKRWLYSDKDIFLRELISNAADAISKLKMLGFAGEFHNSGEEFEIHVTLDKDARTLTVADNGLGMTAEEVKKYINQVAFSSAEEFLQNYQGDVKQQIIGHFGLGFYSAFMVAEHVELDTLSYKPDAEAVLWRCDGTTSFEITASERTTRGTAVKLLIDRENDEFLDEARVRALIRNYCDFLPIPIKFNGEVANRQKPLWTQSPNALKDEDYKEFYSYLYPFSEEPLFWVHLNTDYPFSLQGILYFPRLATDLDFSKGQIKLFCNQVFVSSNCEEVIPQFLTPLQGAIDSPDIPLNVSRSFLQNDRTVQRISDYIAKKVADRLKELFREDRERYVACWKDINLFIKYGIMHSDKFYEQVKDILVFPVSWTETYVTLSEYLERNKERTKDKVYYTSDLGAQSAYLDLFKAEGIEVLVLDSLIDSHFVGFLERQQQTKFARVDSDLDENLLSRDKASELVDPRTNKTRAQQLSELFKSMLKLPKLNVRAESLKTDTTPAVLLMPESLRRFKEMTALMERKQVEFLEEHTLVLNTNHPLIQNVQRLEESGKDNELVELVCQHVYDLALLSQKNFDPQTMSKFVQRSNEVLTRLSSRVV